MTTLNPYLSFKGNCEEAFNFYKSVFGGDFQFIGRYKDVPATDKHNFTTIPDDKIMHISLPISTETILMGCDTASGSPGQEMASGNISLTINTVSKQKADQLFTGLSAGGQVKMPMNETFWEAYFGMLTDKFGIDWMINCESRKNSNAAHSTVKEMI